MVQVKKSKKENGTESPEKQQAKADIDDVIKGFSEMFTGTMNFFVGLFRILKVLGKIILDGLKWMFGKSAEGLKGEKKKAKAKKG